VDAREGVGRSYHRGLSGEAVIARLLARRAEERRARVEARRERLVGALPALVAILERRGPTRVWLFGSLAWGGVHDGSDIDLAAQDLPGDDLLGAQGELLVASPCRVDLLRIEEAPPSLAARIRSQGRVIHA